MSGENFESKKIESEGDEEGGVAVGFEHLAKIARFYGDRARKNGEETTSESLKKSFQKNASQYKEIEEVLQDLGRGGEVTLEKTFEILEYRVIDTEEKMETTKDGGEFEKLEKKHEAAIQAIDFLKKQMENPESSSALITWLGKDKEKDVQHDEQELPVKEGKNLKNQEALKEARRKIEDMEQEKKLIEEVIKNGGAGISMSLPKQYDPNGNGGWSFRPDSTRLKGFENNSPKRMNEVEKISTVFKNAYDEKTGRNWDEVFKREKIFESVAIAPVTEDVYKDEDVKVVEKKLFFKKETAKKERKKVGVEQKLHKDIVDSGKDEPAYRIVYRAQDPVGAEYHDYTGRRGNFLSLEVILPESIAFALMEKIKSNPKIIRDIAKELVTTNIGIPEQAWDKGDEHTKHALRPPYEEWAKMYGKDTKMYIQEEENSEGFRPEWVREI